MFCPQCSHENPAGARFCNGCGDRLETVCARCGHANPPASRFCNGCGQPLGGAAVPTRTPETYTPKHLAEKILTSKAALEGERKQVTVLFADLKGSMELLADRDPEEARKLLDPVLERMMEAVHRYEGTVNQVMGDGIMALFGAPLAHEDHAVRACYAALRMQESVAQYAEGVFRSHGVPIQIRVGLNSGEVVVRAIGSDLHMDYTAVGQTTHLAARMEQMATPGTILLAPATLQLAEGYVQVAARGPVAVKGLPDPVEIYALTGASAQRTRLHAAAARGLTRFVGRDAEIEQIRRALALAHDGHGQLVAVVGEPGVGKSRLVYEFTHSHRTQDWLILEAGSVSYGKATSYLPVIDLLKAYFKVHDRETHREIREKVTGKLLTLDRTLEPTLPALLALLDVPVEDAQWQALDPAAAPPAHPRRRQAPPAPGEPGAAAPRGLRGPALDRCRDAGAARQPGREPADGQAPPAGQLPARVPAWLGEQDLLHASSGSTRSLPRARASCSCALLGDDPAWSRSSACWSDRREPPLHRGERPDAGGDARPHRRARGLSTDPAHPRRSRSRRRCR